MRAEQTLLIVLSSHVSLQEGAGQIMLKMSILRTDDPSSQHRYQSAALPPVWNGLPFEEGRLLNSEQESSMARNGANDTPSRGLPHSTLPYMKISRPFRLDRRTWRGSLSCLVVAKIALSPPQRRTDRSLEAGRKQERRKGMRTVHMQVSHSPSLADDQPRRLYALDWLKMLAVLRVFFIHTGCMFDLIYQPG